MFAANWIMYVEERFRLVREVRDEVLIAGLGMDEKTVYDNRDYYAFHLLVTDAETGEPMATARIRPENDFSRTYVGDIAVREKYAKQANYAEFCLRMLLYKAQKLSAQTIVADIRSDELDMYKKFGFEAVSEKDGKCSVSVARDSVLWPSECHGDA